MSSLATQLLEILARAGRLGRHAGFLLNSLRHDVDRLDKKTSSSFLDYLPIRLVTILESCFRGTIKDLVEGKPEFKTNGLAYISKISNKHLTEIILNLDQRTFTLGDIISHTLPCSKVEDIIGAMESIYGKGFKVDLADSRERWIEDNGNYAAPFIQDVDVTFASIAKLFAVRHILVHELPQQSPYKHEELADFLEHTHCLTDALSWLVSYQLFGPVPRTQTMMNIVSGREASETAQELAKCVDQAPLVSECLEDYDQHSVWTRFAHLVADARSGLSLGRVAAGSISPTLYNVELARLNRWRLADLKAHPDRFSAEQRHRLEQRGNSRAP